MRCALISEHCSSIRVTLNCKARLQRRVPDLNSGEPSRKQPFSKPENQQMKRCPKCNRSFQTDTQKFCTHDGGLLFAIDPSLSETVQFDSTQVHDAVSKPTTR